MWRDMQEKKCEDEMPDVFTYQYRRGGGALLLQEIIQIRKMEQMAVSKLCIYVMLYSETCLQRNSKGLIFFPLQGGFVS